MGGTLTREKAVGTGILLAVSTAMISGVSTFVNFWAVQGTTSDAFIAARNAVVAVMLVPLFLLAGRRARSLSRADWGRLAAIGLVGGAIPFLLFFHGLSVARAEGGAASATFAYRTLFLMATVLAIVFLKERASPRLALGAGALLAGSALLLALTGDVWTDGTAYVLAATALWAGEYTLSKHTLRTLPSATVALGRMGFGAVFLIAYVAATGQLGQVAGLTGVQWQWVGLSALLLVGFVTTWYAGLAHVDLSVASAVLVLAFPVTWALGLPFARTSLGIAEAAGAAAIVFGVALVIGAASLRETWEAVARRVRLVLRRASVR